MWLDRPLRCALYSSRLGLLVCANGKATSFAVAISNGSLYSNPDFRWVQTAFVQPQAMAHDRFLFDPVNYVYTVDRYLGHVTSRYGGTSAGILWSPLGRQELNPI